ncbi:MAG: 4-vinyl reductase [Burkholderiales bacterium]|nr:4-vinyl reductase [Anaerolineae bacterium]
MLESSGLYYPNRIARHFFTAMEDVMGRNGLNALLSLADLEKYSDHPPANTMERGFDFAAMAALNHALEEMYGARGGRAIALRIGRAWVAQGLKGFGAMKGIADPAFRALPLDQRVQLGMVALATTFTQFSDQHSRLEESGPTDRAYRFIVEPSPMAWGRTADRPVCHALVGALQETLRWASNGYEFHAYETSCRAGSGDTDRCVFVVNKRPMGQL